MDAEDAEKGEQYPGDGVFEMALSEAAIGIAIHAGDEEEVHDPADEEEAAGEEPEDAGLRFAEVKAMGAGEAEDPKKVADQFIVSGRKRDVVHSRVYHHAL